MDRERNICLRGTVCDVAISHRIILERGLDQLGRILIVVQNIVSSFFNSYLFDFLEGWIYVVGVGVAGGIALRNRRLNPSPSRP